MKHPAPARSRQKKSKGNKGCLFIVGGTMLVLIAVAIFVLVTGRLTSITVSGHMKGQYGYALMTAATACIWTAFALLEIILFLQFLPSEEDYEQRAAVPTPKKSSVLGRKKTMNILSAVVLVFVVVCAFVSANTYTAVSEDGITTHCFQDRQHYDWKQVTAYTVDCDDDKGLSVTYTMRDGKQVEILQNTFSAPPSFYEKYDSPLSFAVAIDKTMSELQIPRNVKHMDRAIHFYRDDYPKMWEDVAVLIGYTSIKPESDETVPETEPETEKPTPSLYDGSSVITNP